MGVRPSVPAGHRLQTPGEETWPHEEAVDGPGPPAGGGLRGAADWPAGVALPP